MTAALDQSARSALERFVQRARRLLEGDLARHAEGRFGIHPADGAIEDEGGLHLAPDDLVARRDIVDVLHFVQREESDPAAAVARLVREAAFTHLNRLVAIRVAEAIGLLPESLANGPASAGYRELLEVAPLLTHGASGGYWHYLQLCGDELAADLPQLFDPRNPLLELAPSAAAFDEVVELLTAAELDPVWDAPDALGWVYQFFNSGEERDAIHKRGAPRSSAELAIVNQFFTPRYVVDFLVHNSLGRRLLEADPTSPLVDDLPLLLDPPTEAGEPIDLFDVRVLDPACGSGHFLLGAYDVLERAWHHAGLAPEDAAPQIVASLWGIDIDPRCTQVAAAAIVLRARRHCRSHDLPTPNIICARALPEPAEGWDTLLAGLPEDRRQLVAAMRDTLEQAPVLGPLLKVEEQLATEIRTRVAGADDTEDTLFAAEGVANDAFGQAEADVLAVLRQVADQTTSRPAERLLAAEANDAIRFVEAIRHRYDAVLMNPPFGAPVATTKDYLKAGYEWIPDTSDLFALFVGRAVELCRSHGLVGAITSRVGLFLSSFEAWRRRFLVGGHLVCLADLGEGVMDQATVEAASYVLSSRAGHNEARFLRLVAAGDRARRLGELVAERAAEDVFFRSPQSFDALPSAPLAYWVGPHVVERLASFPGFEPSHGVVRVGLQTGDDFQFVRAWWEVAPERVVQRPRDANGRSPREQLNRGCRWAPIIKSGLSQPWYSPVLLVVDWERDGERLRGFRGAVVRNTDLYFRPGFSWTRRAPRLVPYVVPAGCIPSVSRYQAFPSGDPYEAIGAAASNVASAFTRFYGEKFLWPNFLVDNVKQLPTPQLEEGVRRAVAEEVQKAVADRRRAYRAREPFMEFVAPKRDLEALAWNPHSLLGTDLDEQVARAYGLTDSDQAELERDLREALECLGHLDSIDDDGEEPTELDWGQELLSYVVGVAFGRWDVRIGAGAATPPDLGDPFDPPHPVPPGMLTGPDGSPAQQAPAGYPLSIPPDGVLVDEPGHTWDIEDAVVRANEGFGMSVSDLMEAVAVQRGGVREMLRRRFFKEHLATYSAGRRKAPIYWPLYVSSGKWGVWVYAPRLSRETLYVVASEALRREGHAEVEIERLDRERAAGGGGRGAKALDRALDEERKLAEELRRFRQEADRIAGLGWEPDLDDGIVLCAAPLADLFPQWRKELVKYRDELRDGKYEWSTVSKWADQL
jgi:hypothetical protein